MIRIVALLIFLLPSHLSTYAQKINLEGWETFPLPATYEYQNIFRSSPRHWRVSKQGDSICITRFIFSKVQGDTAALPPAVKNKIFDQIPGSKIIRKVSNGYLIFSNYGEFGGGTWFITSTGLTKIIDRNNTESLFELGGNLYTLQTNATGVPSGCIYAYTFDTAWHASLIYEFDRDRPLLVCKQGNAAIILGYNSLSRFTTDKKLTKILTPPYTWGATRPNSFVILNKNLYIGMQHGLIVVESYLQDPVYQCFIPIR